MTIDTLKALVPDYAKDIRLNISSLLNETLLSDQQKYGCFLASALASRNATVIAEITQEAETVLDQAALEAVKTAAAIMAMNNIYYRFLHLTTDSVYGTLPAKLRMNGLNNPGVDKTDFELWALAVSAINGCGLCVDSHEKIVRKAGLSTEQVQAAARIAATVHALSTVIDNEQSLTALADAA